MVLRDDWKSVILCMGICLIADTLDGIVARKMNQSSELGVQLDSLADVISFGLVPGLIAFQILGRYQIPYLPYIGFLLTLGAAFRLARFNVITTGLPKHFQGIPVPSMAICMLGFIPKGKGLPINWDLSANPLHFILVILLLSIGMVSKFPVVKFSPSLGWFRKHILILALSIPCLAGFMLGYNWSLSIMILFYVLSSKLLLSKTH